MPKYIVTTSKESPIWNTPAALYKLTGYRNRATLAATGTLVQMQDLADELNGEEQ